MHAPLRAIEDTLWRVTKQQVFLFFPSRINFGAEPILRYSVPLVQISLMCWPKNNAEACEANSFAPNPISFRLRSGCAEQRDAVLVDDDRSCVAVQFTPTIPHCRLDVFVDVDGGKQRIWCSYVNQSSDWSTWIRHWQLRLAVRIWKSNPK